MDMSRLSTEIGDALAAIWKGISYGGIFRTLGLLLVVGLTIQILRTLVLRLVKARISDQSRMLLKKSFGYAGFVVLTMVLFDSLGFNLSAVLGAAGIAGIAVGFAAQTSISNVISGLFLLSEKPFAIGDVVKADDVTGIVLSIDILSVKIKTFDNTFVRIPNESLIKSKVITVTRYPIRRLDIPLSVSYSSDPQRVLTVLREVVATNRYALANPEPLLLLQRYAASGIEVLLGVWFEKTEYLELKNSLMVEILERFRREGIEIPYPRMDVHQVKPSLS